MLLETNELYEILSFLKAVGPDLGIHLKPSKVKVLLSQQQNPAIVERIHMELTSITGPHCLDPSNVCTRIMILPYHCHLMESFHSAPLQEAINFASNSLMI